MNPQDELLDIIDQYLNKGMSEEERFAFEEKLAQDETLASKVNEVRLTNEAIYYASLAELKNTIGADIKNIKYKASFNWKKASYISIASLALLSGVTTYVYTNNRPSESEKVNHKSSTSEIKQGSAVEKNSAGLSDKITYKNNSNQENTSAKPGTEEPTQAGNTNNQKSILPADNHQKTPNQTSFAEPENKIGITASDADRTKTVTPPEADTKIICDKSFNIHTEASCKQKETGNITIASDGAYSYTFQVDVRTTTGSKAAFSNMSAGVYELMVTYGKECTYMKKVTVPEKWCAMNEAYSFNPDYNEKWILTYENGATGTFTIFDRSGKDIYSNTFGSGTAEWNGNNRLDVPVPVGVYIAFITYSDGRKEKVELTIVR